MTGDRDALLSAVRNLLDNAFAVADTVTVEVTQTPDGPVMSVADDGPGIPAEKLGRLFMPFERLGAEQSNVEGTGLGLALSQRLMHAMGGAIGVEFSAPRGSKFWVELPRAKSPLPKAVPHKRNGSGRRENSKAVTRKVLYIEDNSSNLTLIEEMFAERPQFELLTAMQGKVGLDLARQHSPDLILLDLHLPDLDGHEVLRQLKSLDTTRDVPVVVISADATASQIDRLMKAGAMAYLTKPLDVVEFFRVVDQTTATGGINRTRQKHSAAVLAINEN